MTHEEEITYGWEDDPLGELLERCRVYVGEFYDPNREDFESFWDEALRDIFRVGSSSRDFEAMRFHPRCTDELDLLDMQARAQMLRLALEGAQRHQSGDTPDPYSPERIAIHALTAAMTEEEKRMAQEGIHPPSAATRN